MKLKLFLLLILIVLFSSIATAKLIVEGPLADVYNWGDNIKIYVMMEQEEHLKGLFKLTLICKDYTLPYFATPLFLESQNETEITIPAITLSEPMEGECNVITEFTAFDGTEIEKKQSKTFKVTNQLDMEVIMDQDQFKPTDELIVAGNIKKKDSTYIADNILMINIFDKDHEVKVKEGKFAFKTTIPGYVRSGEHNLYFYITDKNGNKADYSKEIYIQGIPKSIKLKLNKKSFKPKEELKITPLVYDQADNTITIPVKLEINSPKNKKLIEKSIDSSIEFIYPIQDYALPGEYNVVVSKDSFSKQATITVEEVKQLDIKLEGDLVIVINTGNVKYDEQVTTLLDNGEKKYVISKKITLEPSEKTQIDLSKEVPEDEYDITLPESNEVVENKIIHDNRGITTKIGQGISSITGAAVGTSSKGKFSVFIIILIIILVIAYYSRNSLKQLKEKFKKP